MVGIQAAYMEVWWHHLDTLENRSVLKPNLDYEIDGAQTGTFPKIWHQYGNKQMADIQFAGNSSVHDIVTAMCTECRNTYLEMDFSENTRRDSLPEDEPLHGYARWSPNVPFCIQAEWTMSVTKHFDFSTKRKHTETMYKVFTFYGRKLMKIGQQSESLHCQNLK